MRLDPVLVTEALGALPHRLLARVPGHVLHGLQWRIVPVQRPEHVIPLGRCRFWKVHVRFSFMGRGWTPPLVTHSNYRSPAYDPL